MQYEGLDLIHPYGLPGHRCQSFPESDTNKSCLSNQTVQYLLLHPRIQTQLDQFLNSLESGKMLSQCFTKKLTNANKFRREERKKERKKSSNKNVYFSVLCRRYINISTINVKPGSEVSKYVFGDDFINAHLAHFLQFT